MSVSVGDFAEALMAKEVAQGGQQAQGLQGSLPKGGILEVSYE